MTQAPGSEPSVLLSVLGTIRLRAGNRSVPITSGSKSEAYLAVLAIRRRHRLPRSDLLEMIWPGCDHAVSGQCLNSLTHQLNKSITRHEPQLPLVVQDKSFYRLNPSDDVGVDVDLFDGWRHQGVTMLDVGDGDGLTWCLAALELYRGELCAGAKVDVLGERERLRSGHMDLLACVADAYFAAGDSSAALRHIRQLLEDDPCREDAHRKAMRCHMRLGRRSLALHQYRLCCDALEREFDAPPEPATVALYDLIRRDPSAVDAAARRTSD